MEKREQVSPTRPTKVSRTSPVGDSRKREMKKTMTLILAGLVGVSLYGCSTSPTMADLTKDSIQASQVRAEANEKAAQKRQEKMENNLSEIPDWFLEVPKPDSSGVYAVGEGESNKVRVAMKKAMLDAEFGLAKVYGQELSGSERSSVQDSNGDAATSQYTALIDKLVNQVSVVGFETVHQEVKTIDGKYHAFVLLKLPYKQFNAVLQNQAAKTNDAKVEAQFKDLERRLDKRRQQRAEEAAETAKQGSATKDSQTAEVAIADIKESLAE